jgi:5-formyltetrahydrofolate cyclo-ligase
VSKAEVRARIRAARRARSDEARQDAAASLAAQVHTLLPAEPATVCVYLSTPTEPGTDPLIAMVRAARHRVVVPRIVGDLLEWVPLSEDSALTTGAMGIREPVEDALPEGALAAAALILLPALAVDRNGVRLGQGGGYYDRALESVPAHPDGGPLRVVVVFDDEVFDEVPAEPHDCRVDAALSPSGVVAFG